MSASLKLHPDSEHAGVLQEARRTVPEDPHRAHTELQIKGAHSKYSNSVFN